ncbi:MAG: hypothetical protein R6V01_06205 [Thermoplasmatota archaeon]
MNTKIMAFAGLATLALLIGAAFVVAAGGAVDEGAVGDGVFGDMLGSDNGSGDREQAMDENCDPEDAEKVRERVKDGSGNGEPEQTQKKSEGSDAPEEADQTREREQVQDGSCDGEPQGTQQQDRDRDQVNGGKGSQYHGENSK